MERKSLLHSIFIHNEFRYLPNKFICCVCICVCVCVYIYIYIYIYTHTPSLSLTFLSLGLMKIIIILFYFFFCNFGNKVLYNELKSFPFPIFIFFLSVHCLVLQSVKSLIVTREHFECGQICHWMLLLLLMLIFQSDRGKTNIRK